MRDTNEEMGATEIAKELANCRQHAWLLLSTGKIANARRLFGRWWVAPRQDVLTYKKQMAKKS